MRLDNMTDDKLILQKERRSALGKLLAKENITVTHGNFRTAYFDIKNRVLGLPDWSDKSKSVYDMLLGHEVGHALWTPGEFFDDPESKVKYSHFDIVNVLEDIRIERKIQATYPGLPRYFKEGYTELHEKNFFEIADKDISELSFLDRLNLHAKIGTIIDVPLSDDEREIFDRAYAAETFEEVLSLYDEVLKRLEDEKLEKDENGDKHIEESKPSEDSEEQESEVDETPPSPWSPDDDTSDDGEESHSTSSDSDDDSDEESEVSKGVDSSDDSEETDDESESTETSPTDSSEELSQEFISETQRAFDENNTEDEENQNGGYFKIFPTRKENFERQFHDYKTVMNRRVEYLKNMKVREDNDSGVAMYERMALKNMDRYLKFKKDSKKKVGILVREFEQRKAAYQYSRAKVSRTGSIDVTKLHKYKYDDQIFSSVTTLADAKSHGMIFLVDYSGSMSSVLTGVINQILNLTEFCDRVGVPYTVISFTSAGYDDDDKSLFKNEIDCRSLIQNELLSSSMPKGLREKARHFLWLYGKSRNSYYSSSWMVPNEEGLGGTPLDESLANLGYHIKRFRAKHRVQKLNVITLTDGDSHGMFTKDRWNRGRNGRCLELDGKTYKLSSRRYDTETLNEIVAQHYGVNMIGYFLPESKRMAADRISKALRSDMTYSEMYDLRRKYEKIWKKEKHIHMSNRMGYSDYYILDTNVDIREEQEFETDIKDKSGKSMAESRASQNKLAREFAKHHSSSKNVRILMRKFAESIS